MCAEMYVSCSPLFLFIALNCGFGSGLKISTARTVVVAGERNFFVVHDIRMEGRELAPWGRTDWW